MTPLAAHQVRDRAGTHDLTPRIPAFRPQVDDPVRGSDHVEVVLDDHHRVALPQQFAQCAEKPGNVREMQPGGGFVKKEKQALPFPLDGLDQARGQLQTLRLAATQRRHRLPEPEVIQPYGDQRPERPRHVLMPRKVRTRLADGHLQHVRNAPAPV